MNGHCGQLGKAEKETSFSTQNKFEHTGIVSVDFETREGSAKIDKDFKYTQGTLVSTYMYTVELICPIGRGSYQDDSLSFKNYRVNFEKLDYRLSIHKFCCVCSLHQQLSLIVQ